MKKRIVPVLLSLMLVLTVLFALPNQAKAATAQETGNAILEKALAMQGTLTDGCSAECPHCGKTVTWKAFATEINGYVSTGGHYFLQGNTTQKAYQTFAQLTGNICLHMNGFNFSAGYARGTFIGSGRTLTIMGSGIFSSPATAGNRAVVYANGGTVNIYGTTIKTEANNGEPALSLYTDKTTMNLWGATLNAGTNPIITTNGTVNLYNCTAVGGTAAEQDDSKGGNGSTAKLNLYDSTLPGIKAEIATVTVAGATKITGTGLALAEGKTIDPSNLTEGASIAIATEGAFTAAGKAEYAKYFTSATTGLKMIAKQDGTLANLGAEAYGYEVVAQANAMIGKFPTDGTSTYVADCPACGKTDVTWKPMTARPGGADTGFENDAHYFLPKDLTLNGQIMRFDRKTTVCMHMNGKTFTDGTYRFVMVANDSTFNLMGGGVLQCDTKGTRGSVYTNGGTANIYGVTVKNTATVVKADGDGVITQYRMGDVTNVWSSELVGSTVSPVILANGTVNLYNTTATGIAAQIGNYSGNTDKVAALNLYDSSVTGVDQRVGTVTVSGATKITGTGLQLAAGKTIDPSKLTDGAEIMIADECVITGSGMADYVKYFKAVKNGQEITASSDGTLRCWVPKALLVAANGAETVVDDLIAQWATGNYAYIKLYGDDAIELNGQDILVDLAGFDLTVSGTGNVRAFDTANDDYNAKACGAVISGDTITVAEAVAAPNGNRYIAVTEDGRTTAHRLSIKLISVSLRTNAAGLYYKAQYTCDDVLAKKVQAYGVIVSVNNMPGADYANDGEDVNKYTVAVAPFQNGITATSGSVFGIMKTSRDAQTNEAYAKMPIYANAYIDLGNGPIVADIDNPGKTVNDEGFTGTALSLYDVLQKLDDVYDNYNNTTRLQLDNFYAQWKDLGAGNWTFDNIGQTAGTTDEIDNSDIELKFAPGTTDAECPVCKKTVTWKAFTPKTTHQNLNGHYYLTADVVFENEGDAIFYNSTGGTTLCFHLNGHNLTATKTRAVHGSSGRTNIMGNGIVTGYHGTAEYGAAVMANNATKTHSVHLYGGTYRKTSGSNANAAPICVSTVGGQINVYAGATIDNPKGKAIIVKTPTYATPAQSKLNLFGATVNGIVELCKPTANASIEVQEIEIIDAKINGEVKVANGRNVYLAGAPVIQSITLEPETFLITKTLTAGTSIGITNNGIFTTKTESAKRYTEYFHGIGVADTIAVRDNALHCGPDYTGDLKFEAGTTNAMCPVCKKVVAWEAVDGTAQLTNPDKKTKHYYLAEDVTYTANNSKISSYIDPNHGSHTVCFHLNGHDLTLTDTRLIYGGTSVSNIMGSGVVTGVRGDTYSPGGLIQINVSAESGAINLYGGTYRHGSNGAYSASDYTISISGNGGTVNVYDGAKVEANSNGKAIYVGTSNLRSSKLGITGTVDGKIYSEGAKKSFTTTITMDNGTVNGTMDLNGVSELVLSHAAKIQLLDMENTSVVTMDTMTEGANVTVKYDGVFTNTNSSAATYAQYFTGYYPGDTIVVKHNALRCKPGYEEDLKVDAQGKAFCVVCKKTVEWTAISSSENYLVTENGKHYYLTTDIVYNGVYDGNNTLAFIRGEPKAGSTSCFHLNGHNITATQTHGIFGGYGVLNVMGDGVITGWAKSTKFGGAVHVNNSVVGNCVKLYSGTYRNAANSAEGSAVATLWMQGSGLTVYEDADISNPGELAIYTDQSLNRDTNLEIYGATINGDVVIGKPVGTNNKYTKLIMEDVTINGNMTIAAGNEVTMRGKTNINLLTIAKNQIVNFEDMKSGSSIKVSADGIFSGTMAKADNWLSYITCADAGDWIVVRDKQFLQELKQSIGAADESDKAALLNTYAGAELRYGEMHNHTNSGPFRDDGTGYTPSTGADGKKNLLEWIAEMDRLKLDFAFIVDHGMSIHMYNENFRPDYFIGGTEPGTTITDSAADTAKPHYNMLFAYPEELESIFFKWESKFKPMKWDAATRPTAQTPSEDGYRVVYPSFTTEQFTQLAKDVYAAGGLLVQVHPKYSGYIVSDNPLDYYFADYTGLEISTGNGKGYNMMYSANDKAYNLWVDLLELGKKVFATAGSDGHSLPDYSGLTAIYTVNDHKDDYMAAVRAGNIAPGWVGIRMNVNGTAMGGTTSFEGQRLQFSVGDMYNAGVVDYCKTPAVYVAGHTYSVALYDDSGILMSSVIDPTAMNYFAVDCDNDAKYYRIVVWDETDNERVGVSNPIWNTAAED